MNWSEGIRRVGIVGCRRIFLVAATQHACHDQENHQTGYISHKKPLYPGFPGGRCPAKMPGKFAVIILPHYAFSTQFRFSGPKPEG